MQNYSLVHVVDAVLLRDLSTLVAGDRAVTAVLLAYVGEVDARKLYVAEGFSSMFTYCVDRLHFSEGAAFKRIRAARAARRFPTLLKAIAEGRLHLGAAYVLAPHVTAENVEELIEASTHKRTREVEELGAQRFSLPQLGKTFSIRAIATPAPTKFPLELGTPTELHLPLDARLPTWAVENRAEAQLPTWAVEDSAIPQLPAGVEVKAETQVPPGAVESGNTQVTRAARSGSVIRVAVRSSAGPESDVRSTIFWNSTMSSLYREAGERRLKISGYAAERITNTRPSGLSARDLLRARGVMRGSRKSLPSR